MKKIIALILSAVMLLTLVLAVMAAAPAAAEVGKVASGYTPTGTAIDDWSKLTDAAGAYYLTKDITVDATFATAFTGTLDGNGHKVTVSVPMFADLQGTVKNLTMAGAVDYTATASHAGVLAVKSSAGNVSITNVKNEAPVKGYLTNIDNGSGTLNVRTGAAGFIGYVEGTANVVIDGCANTANMVGYAPSGFVGYVKDVTAAPVIALTIKNSVNDGDLSTEGTTKASGGNNASAGGFLAMSDNAVNFTFENLVNNGDITSANTAVNAPAGGIVGYIYTGVKDQNTGLCTITNCVNNGKVLGSNQVGGIGGWVRLNVVATKCVNNGEVESNGNYAGGLFSRVGSDSFTATETELKMSTAKLVDCVNNGKATSFKSQLGGMVGYANTYVECINCINNADLKGDAKDLNVGGICGTVEGTKLVNCINNGDITSVQSYAGGIMGYAPGFKNALNSAANGKYNTEVIGCLNTGAITAGKGAAGIVSNCGRADAYGLYGFTYCVNTGNITSTGEYATVNSNGSAAGIFAYGYGSKGQWADVKYCITTGDIEVKDTAADKAFGLACYFGGYFNSANAVFVGNVATGKLTAPAVAEGALPRTYAICWDNASALKAENVQGNVVPEGYAGALTHEKISDAEVAVPMTGEGAKYTVSTVKADDLTSGKAAYELNKAAGKTVFYQTIGTDAAPSPISTSKVVYIVDGAYTNTAPAAPAPAPTGDSVVAIALALVAVSCGAILTMKKVR